MEAGSLLYCQGKLCLLLPKNSIKREKLPESKLVGAGGIEPPHGGIKIRCLTAWLRPNRLKSLSFQVSAACEVRTIIQLAAKRNRIKCLLSLAIPYLKTLYRMDFLKGQEPRLQGRIRLWPRLKPFWTALSMKALR